MQDDVTSYSSLTLIYLGEAAKCWNLLSGAAGSPFDQFWQKKKYFGRLNTPIVLDNLVSLYTFLPLQLSNSYEQTKQVESSCQ